MVELAKPLKMVQSLQPAINLYQFVTVQAASHRLLPVQCNDFSLQPVLNAHLYQSREIKNIRRTKVNGRKNND